MSKVTVVGAGNVGATCANVLAINEVANEVVLIDVKEGVAEGKAMDIMQTAQLIGFDTVVKGCTNDYSQTSDSDVVVITSGLWPAQKEKDHFRKIDNTGRLAQSYANYHMMAEICEALAVHSPNCLVLGSGPIN